MSQLNILIDKLKKHSLKVITAESLTAGLIASSFADIPGASDVLWGGFIVYTVNAKKNLLCVSDCIVNKFGIVSEEMAKSMAYGAMINSSIKNTIAIAVTGLAGPTGGSNTVPVGTVCIGVSLLLENGVCLQNADTYHFKGNRNAIRKKTVDMAIKSIDMAIDKYHIKDVD